MGEERGAAGRQARVVEEGAHLGVPYSGTVAWCEGTEVPSRPARRGARIVGAALHEGYWVDVQGVRRELERWRSLGARLLVWWSRPSLCSLPNRSQGSSG